MFLSLYFQSTVLRYPRPLQSVAAVEEPPLSTCNPLRQPTHPGQPTRAQETTQLQPTADHPLSVPGTRWGCHPHQETGCCPTWLKTGYPQMPTGLRGPTHTPPHPWEPFQSHLPLPCFPHQDKGPRHSVLGKDPPPWPAPIPGDPHRSTAYTTPALGDLRTQEDMRGHPGHTSLPLLRLPQAPVVQGDPSHLRTCHGARQGCRPHPPDSRQTPPGPTGEEG